MQILAFKVGCTFFHSFFFISPWTNEPSVVTITGELKRLCPSIPLIFQFFSKNSKDTKQFLSRRTWKKSPNKCRSTALCELHRVSLCFYVCKQHCTIALASVNSSRLWLGVADNALLEHTGICCKSGVTPILDKSNPVPSNYQTTFVNFKCFFCS